MKKHHIFSVIITGFISIYGMDESKKSESQIKLADKITKVTSWHDIAPFLGKVIAYKTKSSQFPESSKNAYFFGDDSSFVYGYVCKDHIERYRWFGRENEKGVWVIRLSKNMYDWKDLCKFYEDDLEKDAAHIRCVTS